MDIYIYIYICVCLSVLHFLIYVVLFCLRRRGVVESKFYGRSLTPSKVSPNGRREGLILAEQVVRLCCRRAESSGRGGKNRTIANGRYVQDLQLRFACVLPGFADVRLMAGAAKGHHALTTRCRLRAFY